jgi:hypothetical protein
MKVLADLVERFQLYAVCSDCERMERLDLGTLIVRLGGSLEISALRKRLRCGSCHVRTGDIRIVYVGENRKVSGFHYGGRRPAAQPFNSSVDSSVSPNPSTPT